MNKMFCPRNCEHLSLKESEQVNLTKKLGFTPPHICNKYKMRVFHLSQHPALYRCAECYKENVLCKE
jgi:hypothetical protein